ncbi:MAG: EamA family transporter [Eubacteriales bacterium]|nr:EamA family transporter [Eubacteriales bacterium]
MKRLAPVFILIAGSLWGIMGIFVRKLGNYGFSSIQIASLRIMGGAVIFVAVTALYDKDKLRIRLRDIGWFIGLGVLSILMFTVCYFTTISMASLSVAAILLYTAPVMVMLMSLVLFHEKLDTRKVIALGLAFTGCILVTGMVGGGRISLAAVGFGLMSGFGYGLYSILGTFALRKYSPVTVTTYAFLCGGAGALFVCRPGDMAEKIAAAQDKGRLVLLIFLTAFITAVLPYLFYTIGLSYVKASSASIMASIEPVVATIAGVAVFHEGMTGASFAGVVLVLAAIVLLNLPAGRSRALAGMIGQNFHSNKK